jgi:hypothetical protein
MNVVKQSTSDALGKAGVDIAGTGPAMRFFLGFVALFFAGLVVALIVDAASGGSQPLWIWIGLIALAVGSALAFVDSLFRHITWTDEVVVLQDWQGARQVRWKDIGALKRSIWLQLYHLSLPEGGFTFSEKMSGADRFIAALHAHLSNGVSR